MPLIPIYNKYFKIFLKKKLSIAIKQETPSMLPATEKKVLVKNTKALKLKNKLFKNAVPEENNGVSGVFTSKTNSLR